MNHHQIIDALLVANLQDTHDFRIWGNLRVVSDPITREWSKQTSDIEGIETEFVKQEGSEEFGWYGSFAFPCQSDCYVVFDFE